MNSTSDLAAVERPIYVGLAAGDGRPVVPAALLKLLRQGVVESGELAYGRHYLASPEAQALNPATLPLQREVFVLQPRRIRDGGALPLTLQDALPDSWGRRVLEARFGPLQDIDALLRTNDDRVGALVFSERLPIEADEPAQAPLELQALAEASQQLEAGAAPTPRMRELLRGGGTLGGARPKATFVHRSERYIAKFASRADDADMEIVEAATLQLAAQCGLDVPASLLVPLARGHALLVRRFDRVGHVGAERRLPYLSCAALLDAPYASNLGSYAGFAALIRRISTRPRHDLDELFARMVFNLAIGNSDDHVKNHGMLAHEPGRWQLAPAFDLLPQLTGHLGRQELALLPGRHDSSLALARETAPQFGIGADAARHVIDRLLEQVATQIGPAIRAQGGDATLAQRVHGFVAQHQRRLHG